jgi:GH24 family phage-related lysozyme (muramidase)
MTNDQLAAYVPDLVRFEGSVGWMYRDVAGYVTVGIGNLIHDADDAMKFPFVVVNGHGRAATSAEINADFGRVIALARGMMAKAYRAPSGMEIELTDEAIRELAIGRLRSEFLPGLSRLCKGFETFPAPARAALVDLSWNLGLRGLETFGHMLAAVDRRDWAAAAEHCHRRTSRPERNDWCRAKFFEASGATPAT